MFPKRFDGVLGTAGLVTTGFGEPGRDHPLINFDRDNQNPYQQGSDPPDQKEFIKFGSGFGLIFHCED